MSRTIVVPDDLFERIEKLAKPFVDHDPADVIRRALEQLRVGTATELGNYSRRVSRKDVRKTRRPRERGVRVRFDNREITATSVKDLYEQVLDQLLSGGHVSRAKKILPYKTSNRRYLIAEKATHPKGNPFVVPVSKGGLAMEAHKAYSAAVSQLSMFAAALGLDFEHLS